MVHDAKGEGVKIKDVARYVKRHDLPLPMLSQHVTAGKAINEKAALGRPITISDKRLIRAKASEGHREAEDAVPILVAQKGDALQLANELAVFWMQRGETGHGTPFQLIAGGSPTLLSHDAPDV
jgi:hypothetical protein